MEEDTKNNEIKQNGKKEKIEILVDFNMEEAIKEYQDKTTRARIDKAWEKEDKTHKISFSDKPNEYYEVEGDFEFFDRSEPPTDDHQKKIYNLIDKMSKTNWRIK